MSYKFALRNFLGQIKSYFLVEEEKLSSSEVPSIRTPGHLIFVCDASGSMWGQMDALKSLVVKLLTLEEYRDADVLISVLSFSSAGDIITHAARVKVGDFMTPGSKALSEVQKLSTRGLTCISQGLRAIPNLLRDDELTAAVVLSDGFANDVSPGAEKREIDALVENLRTRKNLFVNTISLGSWADFNLLSFMANACSGTCFQAPSAKEVYDVLHATTSLVAGATSPAIEVKLNGADYGVFLSRSSGKILGSGSTLLVRGLRSEDDRTIYRFRKVGEEVYAASPAAICEDVNPAPLLAFAKAQLAEGAVNTAKYALVATKDETLLLDHARALTSTEIAAMAASVERATLGGIPSDHVRSANYGLPNAGILSVLGVLDILAEYARDVEVDVDALRATYKKRGVKRVEGVRNEDGSLTTPTVKTARKNADGWASLSSVDVNRDTATCNMLVSSPIRLVKADDGAEISEVAGIRLDLRSHNNYTLVGDGELNVTRLAIRIANKRLFRALVSAGVLSDGDFDPKVSYEVVLEGRPLIAYDASFDPTVFSGVFERAARLKILESILTACMKGQSDAYTAEQLAELGKYYITGGMNFSPPTTTSYVDLKAALASGEVDTRLSYKIKFGTGEIANLGELLSANAYLQRRFTLTVNGQKEEKPKFEFRWEPSASFGIKPTTARMALNAVDDLTYPIFCDFLGVAENGTVAAILTDAGMDADQVKAFTAALRGKVSKDTAVEAFTDARKAVSKALDAIFIDRVSPVVFYVGATGLIPDEFQTSAMTAEQVKQKYPKYAVKKDAADGTFYEVGTDTILSVSVTPEYFSTGKVA